MSNATKAALRARLKVNQRMKRCGDCGETKPRCDFQLRTFGNGVGLTSFCHHCASLRRQRASKYRREYMDSKRREAGAVEVPARGMRVERNSGHASSYRMPDDSEQDYIDHAMSFRKSRNSLALMKLAISGAPRRMLPGIMRGLRAAMAA